MSALRATSEEETRGTPELVEIVSIQTLSIAKTHEEALTRLKKSRIAKRHAEHDLETMVEANLVGTPEELLAKVSYLEGAGVSQISAQNFACDTYAEMLDMMQMFGEEVVQCI